MAAWITAHGESPFRLHRRLRQFHAIEYEEGDHTDLDDVLGMPERLPLTDAKRAEFFKRLLVANPRDRERRSI